MTTNYQTIDKLTATLFTLHPSGDDQRDAAAIVASYSALQRKLKAAGLDGHSISVRPKGNDKPSRDPIKTYDQAKVDEAFKRSEEELKAERKQTARWQKMAGDYEHDLNKAFDMMAEHGYDRQTDKWDDASNDVLEAVTAAVKADRKQRNVELLDQIEDLKRQVSETATARRKLEDKLDAIKKAWG